MKANVKIYPIADKATPVEVQEFDDKKVEIYFMDDFPALLEELTSRQKFSMWTSLDGKAYRLFIESGYYEKVKDLYKKEVNQIWLKFWDKAEKATTNASYKIMFPTTILIVIIYFVLGKWVIPAEYNLHFSIGIFALFILGSYAINKFTKKHVGKINASSVEDIKKELGAKHFEKLLEDQKDYIDVYYLKKYPETVNENEEVKEENKTE